MGKSISSREDIKIYFKYDPESGFIYCLNKYCNIHIIGSRVDREYNYGYKCIVFKKKCYLAHRIAWFLYYGIWPAMDIDHINGDRSDNRLSNLRLATRSQNLQNQKIKPNKSFSVYKGVTKARNKFCARIKINYKCILLGNYKSELEAALAYDEAALIYHGEFAMTNKKLGLL